MKRVLLLCFLLVVTALRAAEASRNSASSNRAVATPAYVVDHSHSTQARLRPLPLEAVEWTTGFWADRYRQLCEVTLEESWKLLADPAAGHVLDNFRFAAKPGSGQYAGTT